MCGMNCKVFVHKREKETEIEMMLSIVYLVNKRIKRRPIRFHFKGYLIKTNN